MVVKEHVKKEKYKKSLKEAKQTISKLEEEIDEVRELEEAKGE